MKVAIDPYDGELNKYIELIKKSILELNIEVNPFRDVFFDKELMDSTDYYIFNWYESLYTNSLIKQIARFIKKYIKLLIIKSKNKKIIWVLHNKIPHDSKYKFCSIILMKFFVKNSYKIIIHSNESKKVLIDISSNYNFEEKIVYVPHPNYIDVYKPFVGNYNNKNLTLLFIGAIKPYKNVDLLIEVFNELNLPNVKLILAGKVVDIGYENYIKKLINNNNNIETDFRFIEDDEINSLINHADALVLPYDIKSSLNSGTIMLAFSNKRTVLTPTIGTIKDIDKKEMYFTYEYDDELTHRLKLKEGINMISQIHKEDASIVRKMGESCYLFVKENNSIEKVSKCIEKLFK